jgi:beta-glucosidase
MRYWDGESTPLYPFGFGLSYATFSFSNLLLDRPELKVDESLDVSVDAVNTSDVPGDQVVQLDDSNVEVFA